MARITLIKCDLCGAETPFISGQELCRVSYTRGPTLEREVDACDPCFTRALQFLSDLPAAKKERA
jgi:hypothetical protein